MTRNRIFLGYDAVDNDFFSTKAEEIRSQMPEVRCRLGFSKPFFLASARFVEKKNLPRLIQAYARYRDLSLKTDDKNGRPEIWDLILLGDGPLKSDLCGLISDLRLGACVHMPGFKQYNDLPFYYVLAGAFVHASTTEQWGLVVNEAMSSGLPVLVSNRCGCAADLIRDGYNGFTFDPYDIEALARLMIRVATLPAVQLANMGDASRTMIAPWGSERFAKGLFDAVKAADCVPSRQASIFDRLLLKALLLRRTG
jgi:glycosyltransferase involved in cell wall biosynthesis